MVCARECAGLQIELFVWCSVYERAFRSLREHQPDAKEEAVMLLEAWRAFEGDSSAAEQRQVSLLCVHHIQATHDAGPASSAYCPHDTRPVHSCVFSQKQSVTLDAAM